MIVTVALEGLTRLTLSGNDPGTMIISKSSSSSLTPSLVIGISNGKMVTPAGIVTGYGPGP